MVSSKWLRRPYRSCIDCPSRREAKAHPWTPDDRRYKSHDVPNTRSLEIQRVGKTDYSLSSGEWDSQTLDARVNNFDCITPLGKVTCPDVHTEALDTNKRFAFSDIAVVELNGVVFAGSKVRPRHVTDGMSKTYLIGERYLPIGGGEYNRGVVGLPWNTGAGPHLEAAAAYHPLRDARKHRTLINMKYARGPHHRLVVHIGRDFICRSVTVACEQWNMILTI